MPKKIKPEYLKFRCCMCPNGNSSNNIQCPAGHSCRFVKSYYCEGGTGVARIYPESKDSAIIQAHNIKNGRIIDLFVLYKYNGGHFDELQTHLNTIAQREKWQEYKGEDVKK